MHRRSRGSRIGSPILATGVVALLLAACGSTTPGATSGATTGPTSAATTVQATAAISIPPAPIPTATPAPLPTGPATFELTVAGDPKVTGVWQTATGINCSNPTLGGLNILVFGTSPDGAATVVMTFTQGLVTVSERSGSGDSYRAREFKGTGVSAYDPARGATFDSDVEIVPTPDVKGGTLGTIKHVSGSVDCGGQTTGTSTVVASGSSAEGPVEGPFTQFRVICNDSTANGLSANIIAVIDTTTPPVYLIINLPSNANSTIFTITDKPSRQHSYTIDKAGTFDVTATGFHVDADYNEVVEATATPHVIHLEGDGTCGTFNKIA